MNSSTDLPRQINSHLAATIRRRRTSVGLPQKCLADALGITQQAMSNLEAGKTTIGAETLWWIAMVLDTTVSSLFDEFLNRQQSSGPTAATGGNGSG